MNKYNKTNIIVLALLYNYLATKENKIKKTYFDLFFSELNYELLLKEQQLISEEESAQNVYIIKEKYIELSCSSNLPYSLIYMKRQYVDALPYEIIESSLSGNVLSTLKLNRSDINTKTCFEPRYLSNNVEIPSNDKTKKIIKLNTTAFPTTFTGNVCLSVEREVIDLDPLMDEYESKQK